MKDIKKMTLASLFLALGLILPFFTGQIPEIGSMLLPMHIPVLICGFLCGWKYGLLVGFITPILRSFLFGMPPLLTAISMAFELAVYGLITGILYPKFRNSKFGIYISLLAAMLSGRIVWGFVSVIIYGLSGAAFTWQIFIGGALLNAIPGILLQLILIPSVMLIIQRFSKSGPLQ